MTLNRSGYRAGSRSGRCRCRRPACRLLPELTRAQAGKRRPQSGTDERNHGASHGRFPEPRPFEEPIRGALVTHERSGRLSRRSRRLLAAGPGDALATPGAIDLPGAFARNSRYDATKHAVGPVAQRIEQQPSKLKVPGSNPGGVANYMKNNVFSRWCDLASNSRNAVVPTTLLAPPR